MNLANSSIPEGKHIILWNITDKLCDCPIAYNNLLFMLKFEIN